MDESLTALLREQQRLKDKLQTSDHRDMFRTFLERKRRLHEEEERLAAEVEQHEEALADIRASLCDRKRIEQFLPADPARQQLYLHWKQALADKEALLRQARRRKYDMMRTLKARHEAAILMLEQERRAALEELEVGVAAKREQVESSKAELESLDRQIDESRASMQRFREEFEQLRVALLVDRMTKNSQIASLADRRRRLAQEAQDFQSAVEAARKKVAEEEKAKWAARLEEEKRKAEERVAEEKQLIAAKLAKVKETLMSRYEEGFKPLLAEAEARHMEEVRRVARLQAELREKEEELRRTQQAARASALSAWVSQPPEGDDTGTWGGGVAGSVACIGWVWACRYGINHVVCYFMCV